MRFDQAAFESAAGKAEQLPASTLPEIVFSGRSNVGKSSLINKLVNRKSLARVSATPGKTGTINFYQLGGARLVDLPGYGYAKVSFSEKKRWAELVEGYFHQPRDIRLVVQIVDMRHPPTRDDMQMISFLCENELPFLVALTKCDKLNKSEREKRRQSLNQELGDYEGIVTVECSSVNGEGLKELQEMIASCVEDEETEFE
ncbi:MAG: YihA family ribosome biogenesis GTP-binding protein [Clostridiales bacterium]|jgi:GTP-binding protein|nr:YihA family ribosome biogenesis GTP-binding protein [Clostridiales bacterium]